MKFMLDRMLVKLGKYLRILGQDAAWDVACDTRDLILRANTEGRIFVTRNTHILEQFPRPVRLVGLRETDPVRQLHGLASELGMDMRARLFTSCIRCNVPLEAVADKAAVRGRVHPNVFVRYQRFFTCPKCGTVFWRGSHVRNTCRKLGLPSAAEG